MLWLKPIRNFCSSSGRTLLPILIGIIASVAIFGLSHQLLVQEQLHLKQLIHQQTTAIETNLNNQLTWRILALKRMANHWVVSGIHSRQMWEAEVRDFMQDVDGYREIQWLDSSFRVRWAVPKTANETSNKFAFMPDNRRQSALEIARHLHQPFLTPTMRLVQGGKGFLAIIPLAGSNSQSNKLSGNPFDGFVVGVFQVQSLFDSILKLPSGYYIGVYDGTELIYTQGIGPSQVKENVPILAYGVNWHLDISPTPELLKTVLYPLPKVFLISGLISVWLLVFVIYLTQVSFLRIRLFQRAKHQLDEEIIHRQEIETELQNSRSRFAGILEIASDAIISVDTNQSITLFNQGAERIFGYKAEEVLGKPLSLLMPDRFGQAHRQYVSNYSHTSNSSRQMGERGTIFGRRKDGTEFPAEASISKLNLNGEIIFTTFLRDVTERKQAEQALQQSQSRFQAFMNHSPMAAWITDKNGQIIYANPTYFKTFQLANQEVINKSIFEIFYPTIAANFLKHIQTVAETQQVIEAIEEVPRCNGNLGKFLVYKFPLAETSAPNLVGGLAIDITERQQAESELRKMTEALENAVSGISRLDNQGRYIYVNKSYASVAGYQPEEMIGMNWEKTVHPQNLQKVIDAYNQMLQDGSVELEATGIRQDGSIFYKHLVMIAIWDEQKQLLGNHCFMKDITERKRIEEELRQAMEAAQAANLAKSTFLANMSHELRTPLNVILGFAQVMARDPYLMPEQQENLQTIRRSGDHLLNLINDVLDLSKIEAGRCCLEEAEFDLISLLYSLGSMLGERAHSKGLQLKLDIAPQLPQFILADLQKLRQVLLNLLSNAIKFTEAGTVTLKVSEKEPTANINQERKVLIFEVSDTGVGIAKEELDIIFDAFVQAKAGKISTAGTGLGLTISRKLIEIMGGEISVRSTLGEGTTFTFTIPVSPSNGVNIQEKKPERLVIGLAPGQANHRILVVDDRRENRLLLVKLLNSLGLEVREATNGLEAVQLCQEWRPDLIWMDIRMPVLDGYEATRQIRATKHGESSIIIALTAQASQSDRNLALAAGCNDYITKPFEQETLFLKMAEHLGLKYIYAENYPATDTPLNSFSPSLNETFFSCLNPVELSVLPTEWFAAVENAAMCGDDTEVEALIAQIPPSLANLSSRLTQLTTNFEFEQIIELIQTLSSSLTGN